MNTDENNLILELTYVVDALNEALPGGTSSASILQTAGMLMIARRLDMVLDEAAKDEARCQEKPGG